MSLTAYIVLSFAFGICNMMVFRRCAEAVPISLIRGLLLTMIVSIVHTGLFLSGMVVGDLIRFELPDNPQAFSRTNAYVFAGLTVLVMLRTVLPYFRRRRQPSLFNLADNRAFSAMAFATGIGLLLVGLGAGFVASAGNDFHKAVWPLLSLSFLFGYLGVMFGRQKVAMRPRRWMVLAGLLMAGVAVAAVVNA